MPVSRGARRRRSSTNYLADAHRIKRHARLPLPGGHAILIARNDKRGRTASHRRNPRKKTRYQGYVFGDHQMKSRQFLGLLCAAAILNLLAGRAFAEDKVDKI